MSSIGIRVWEIGRLRNRLMAKTISGLGFSVWANKEYLEDQGTYELGHNWGNEL